MQYVGGLVGADSVHPAMSPRRCDEARVIVGPFAKEGLNALRVSPNTANTVADLDRFFDLLN